MIRQGNYLSYWNFSSSSKTKSWIFSSLSLSGAASDIWRYHRTCELPPIKSFTEIKDINDYGKITYLSKIQRLECLYDGTIRGFKFLSNKKVWGWSRSRKVTSEYLEDYDDTMLIVYDAGSFSLTAKGREKKEQAFSKLV